MPGLLRGIARTAVISGTATHVSNNVSRRQANKWAAQEAEQQPAAPQASAGDPYAELEKLAGLKDQGVITQEEFDAKKKQLLGL
jgi:membrane protease subunit (stomatin/prohibitin family)